VSHSNRKTRRRFLPNIQDAALYSEALGETVRLRVSTRGIRTVERDEDGDVSDYFDPLLIGVILQVFPLAEEKILNKLMFGDGIAHLSVEILRDGPFVGSVFLGPIDPRTVFKVLLERTEECVGLEPVGVFPLECGPAAVGFLDRRAVCHEALGGKVEKAGPKMPESTEINSCSIARSGRGNLVFVEKAETDEIVQIDEIGISGKSGKALVGGIPVAGRSEGAGLPEGETAVREQVHETEGFFANCPDPGGAGKSRRVEENAAAAPVRPVEEWRCLPPLRGTLLRGPFTRFRRAQASFPLAVRGFSRR